MKNRRSNGSFSFKWIYFFGAIAIALATLFHLTFNTPSIQEVKVYQGDLEHTIGEIASLSQEEYFNLPDGIVNAAFKVGKDGVSYGTILKGNCNAYFSHLGTPAYLKAHPQDLVWKEHLGDGEVMLWIFLEAGTKPDPEFLKIH